MMTTPEVFIAVVIMGGFLLTAGSLSRRLVRLIRKDSCELQCPQLARIFDLAIIALGTYLAVDTVNSTVRGWSTIQGWPTYLLTGLVVIVVISIPVLAIACVVLVNRHLDDASHDTYRE